MRECLLNPVGESNPSEKSRVAVLIPLVTRHAHTMSNYNNNNRNGSTSSNSYYIPAYHERAVAGSRFFPSSSSTAAATAAQGGSAKKVSSNIRDIQGMLLKSELRAVTPNSYSLTATTTSESSSSCSSSLEKRGTSKRWGRQQQQKLVAISTVSRSRDNSTVNTVSDSREEYDNNSNCHKKDANLAVRRSRTPTRIVSEGSSADRGATVVTIGHEKAADSDNTAERVAALQFHLTDSRADKRLLTEQACLDNRRGLVGRTSLSARYRSTIDSANPGRSRQIKIHQHHHEDGNDTSDSGGQQAAVIPQREVSPAKVSRPLAARSRKIIKAPSDDDSTTDSEHEPPLTSAVNREVVSKLEVVNDSSDSDFQSFPTEILTEESDDTETKIPTEESGDDDDSQSDLDESKFPRKEKCNQKSDAIFLAN